MSKKQKLELTWIGKENRPRPEPPDLTISPVAEIPGRRNADLTRFTIDRLIKILNRLDQQVNINIEVQPR